MIQMNGNYQKLHAHYLFSEISRHLEAFQAANPEASVIKLGIGDVTLPLPQACVEGFHQGVEEMAREETFHGYGPEQGYAFLREIIAKNEYKDRGIEIDASEIFISDGAKCDTGNFQELFSLDTRIGVPDPVYPVYVDSNVMAGRSDHYYDGRYEGICYLEANEGNGFVPKPPEYSVDCIYLCFPNNPTGACASKEELSAWIDYAREHKALILYDAAYEAFIRDSGIPKSIFDIDGSREVAIEFRSFSKMAGFTGVRCAYTVIPKECRIFDSDGRAQRLHPLWNRRQSTKFNGVSYPVQKAAEAVYTQEGQKQVRTLIDYYMKNAQIIVDKLNGLGFSVYGGRNAPYIWIKTGGSSWDFFNRLLNETGVVCTPGSGFGKCGEGYIRISAFIHREKVELAMDRWERAGLRPESSVNSTPHLSGPGK